MSKLEVPWEDFLELARRAVAEDLPAGDPTGALVGDRPARASLVARQGGTISGLVAAQIVLDLVSERLNTGKAQARLWVEDGDTVEPGAALGELRGPANTLLAAERTVLNLLTHLSGIATATTTMVQAVSGTGSQVRDTRKTLPGMRAVEKYAVRCGGALNHRMSLSDAILIKDNHVAAFGSVARALEAAKHAARSHPGSELEIEVEVDTLMELDEALAAGARLVLIDNMSVQDTREAVARAKQAGAKVEASGGITVGNARAIADCGVDYISSGAITHSAPALDIGLDWDPLQ
jgi:nicotinate-nucleotide pyrophosphorylase (carboxylating)